MNEEKPERTKLEDLQRKTMAKSMRNLEDILADIVVDPNVKLSDNEQRLVDRHLFEKTGKHFGKFKDKTPKPVSDIPTVGKNRDNTDAEGKPIDPDKKKPKMTITRTESVS